VLLLCAAGCETAAPRQGGAAPAQIERTDRLFAAWDRPDSPGCALGIEQDGALIYSRGYGAANLECGAPLTPKSVFRLASVSKQFTAACFALLEEQDRLSLDDSVRRFVPELPAWADGITLRQMLHHVSGIPEYLSLLRQSGAFARKLDFFDAKEALDALASAPAPDFAPGERYEYSNSNYFLMSLVVERASGQSLRAFMAEHVFGPLGMSASHIHDDATEVVPGRATGYRQRRRGGFAIDETTLEVVGDDGVFTTVEDLVLWDRNFYDNRLGRGGPALIELLQTPALLPNGEPTEYALGLRVDRYRGLLRIHHGGSWVGFRTNITRFPERRFTVICLCNLRDIDATALATQVAEIWLEDAMQPPAEGER
jgi:CubicO group peptidase (beta-lactamase class C family)